MAKLRTIKKEISFLAGEVISNCYMAIYFQGEEAIEPLSSVIEKAVVLHDSLRQRANHPAEKHNKKLVRKHYTAIRVEMLKGADELFEEISKVCSSK